MIQPETTHLLIVETISQWHEISWEPVRSNVTREKRFGGQSTLSAGSPCTHSVLQWKKQDNNDYGWYSFLNSSLSLHVCGCQVSAIEARNIQNMTLARSHWLPEVSHQRQPDQNIIDIKGLCSGQGHSISIRSSEIIVMTPHNRGFFRPLFFLFATSL